VKRYANAHRIPVLQPQRLRDAPEVDQVRALRPDALVVAAYGLLLPPPLLEAGRYRALNIHASLLPRWRGAAPIQRALLAGDAETGITIFQMEPSLDTGPILAMKSVPIGRASTAQSLHDDLAALAARMIGPVVDDLAAGHVRPHPQAEQGVTYAPKVDKAEGRLDWTRPAALLERQVRALEPWPGCWTELGGQRLRVLAAELVAGHGVPGEVLDERLTIACGEGALRLTRLQPAGSKAMASDVFLRGHRVPIGSRLGP
jgi:methionyl-tRNA formyltransferase